MTGKHELEEILEEIVDAIGLSVTVELLSRIAYAKAEHLRANWQDEESAKLWTKDAKRLDRYALALQS